MTMLLQISRLPSLPNIKNSMCVTYSRIPHDKIRISQSTSESIWNDNFSYRVFFRVLPTARWDDAHVGSQLVVLLPPMTSLQCSALARFIQAVSNTPPLLLWQLRSLPGELDVCVWRSLSFYDDHSDITTTVVISSVGPAIDVTYCALSPKRWERSHFFVGHLLSVQAELAFKRC